MQIYLYQNDKQIGPYTEEDLRSMVASGVVSRTENAWHDGLTEWQPLDTVVSLNQSPALPPLPSLPLANTTQPQPSPFKSIAQPPQLPSSVKSLVRSMTYKVVPFSASVASHQDAAHVAAQIESIITSYTANGWEYVGVHQLQTFKSGSNGCFGLGATPPMTITTEFVVFRQS
jgi:hypothetical protein